MSALEFGSRRPSILSTSGMVSCSDPHAARAGLDILRAGGNAADAAVAMAAALNVTLPMSTGLGGDAFCLFYDATQQVHAVNGSGRSAAALDLDLINKEGFNTNNPFPINHGHAVTVPGAAAAWIDTVETLGSGKVSMGDILAAAISLAEEGFPVTEVAAHLWQSGSAVLKSKDNVHGKDMLIDGKAPKWGQVFKNGKLARTMKSLSTGGKSAFYEGPTGRSIVEAAVRCGSKLTLEDLSNHKTTFEQPICTEYKGMKLWEIPPNSQGIVALMALNVLKGFDLKAMGHNSVQYLHHLVEALKLAFADAMAYVADPASVKVPVTEMLSEKYAKQRRACIKNDRAVDVVAGDLAVGTDTVYMTAADKHGNACSFINSNYMGFGTGIVPEDCGFTLQNRGCNFSLEAGHPNVIAPSKRPYHTIIPAMLTDNNTGELLASYGVMGGFMQPQGHVQVLLNMYEFGMSPQQALDAARFCVGEGHTGCVGAVFVETGIPQHVILGLQSLGHEVRGPVTGYNRALFGRGHVISRGAWWCNNDMDDILSDPAVWWGGSDPRADGLVIGY